MSDPAVESFETRSPIFCTECNKIHAWPIPKFSRGQRARILSGGHQHQDKIGSVVTITGIQNLLTMPCDEVEYLTSAGGGSISESRLEAQEGP